MDPSKSDIQTTKTNINLYKLRCKHLWVDNCISYAWNSNSSWQSYGRGNSLKDPASKAYAKVLAPHHGWAIRKAVAAGMYALPTKAQLLKKLNEDGECVKQLINTWIEYLRSSLVASILFSNLTLCISLKRIAGWFNIKPMQNIWP